MPRRKYTINCIVVLFSFAFSFANPFISIGHKTGDLSEVVSYICNIIILFSQILHSVFEVKVYFQYAYFDSLLCCKVPRVFTNM